MSKGRKKVIALVGWRLLHDLNELLLTFFVLTSWLTSKQDAVNCPRCLEKFSDTGQSNAKVMENTIPDISHEKNDEKMISKKERMNYIRS